MKSPIKGDQEERDHTTGTGPAATGVPPTRGEAAPKGKGAPAGSGAEEDYPATAKPGGAGGEVQDPLSLVPPSPPAPDSEAAAEGEGTQGSLGRREIVKGPKLLRLLRERLEEPDWAGVRSAWKDVELVWRILWALVAKMDLGGMGPLVA